ncbi:MAG: class I adenylate-forming enzyme family protein [Acidimicrobiales bacterium]
MGGVGGVGGAGGAGGAGGSVDDDWAPQRDPSDTGHLLLTSGTTGHPKAVMETLPACWAKMQFFADAFGPRPGDVMLLYLPVAHVFGLRLAMLTLLSGGRLVLADRFSPAGALDLVSAEGVTVLPGMPAHFTLMLGALDGERHDVSSLRWAISAASKLPAPLVDQIYDRLDVNLLYVYGCSENFTVQSTDRDEIAAGSVGRLVYRGPEGTPPNGTIAVLDPETGEELPRGTVGELAFGAAHPVRYWKAPDAATDGWYRTGDLGRVDPDGRVYVLGRLKELINRGGLHVSPAEVETAVARHPGAADSAVVGTPDPVLGEAICACVVTGAAPVPDLDELRHFLAPTLARHKLPDELCLVDAIPRTKIGKVDRPALVRVVVDGGRPRQCWRPR